MIAGANRWTLRVIATTERRLDEQDEVERPPTLPSQPMLDGCPRRVLTCVALVLKQTTLGFLALSRCELDILGRARYLVPQVLGP